ncbi:MAG: Peptide chain release factor subunit 1 [Methanonatronarchaeales archaeon]|nr:Peptide chain release factor subunit 1 [Methanonatronarchaeales archaeon]
MSKVNAEEELSDSEAKYRFARELERLEDKRGEGTELITLYVPPDKDLNDVMRQLRDERSQASNIKSKRTKKNVQSALDVLMGQLKQIEAPPERGMIMMAGEVRAKGDRTSMETEILVPPRPLVSYRYHCDSHFLLEPLKELVEEKNTYGLLVLDRRESTVGLLVGGRVEALKRLTSAVPGKTKAGGQSQARFERLRDQAAHEFYKRIAKTANRVFQSEDLRGVLVGGPSPTKEEFMSKDLLHHEVNVLGLFDVTYTDEYGLRELVESAEETLSEAESAEERREVKRFLRALVDDETPATYGEEQVRRALTMGAVDTLLLSEDLRRESVEFTCPECGEEGRVTVEAGEEPRCPSCGAAVSGERRDFIRDLSRMAEDTGADVVIASSEFAEGAQLRDAFGGVAALLRFEVGY